MEVKQIVVELDQQIARLKEARGLLAGETSSRRKPGRLAGISAAPPKARKKRNLTPEGRKRISEALKRRWAARRKAVAKTAKAA